MNIKICATSINNHAEVLKQFKQEYVLQWQYLFEQNYILFQHHKNGIDGLYPVSLPEVDEDMGPWFACEADETSHLCSFDHT